MTPTLSDYLARGWAVFPCHSIQNGQCTCSLGARCDKGQGKHPRTMNGVNDASKNPYVVDAWERQFPGCNWGVATGEISGMWAIDLDPRKGGYETFDEYELRRGEPLPTTLVANTGGDGKHVFFAYPTDGTKIGNRVEWMKGIDIRGNGGYVILAGGNHISGGTYSWVDYSVPIAPAPQDLIARLASGSGRGAAAALEDTDRILDGVPEGKRDDTIFRFACRLRRQLGDSARAAVQLLVLQAAENASPPFPRELAIAKVDQAFKQDHSDPDDEIFADPDDPIFNLTDMGNRDRFIKSYGDDIRYVDGMGWFGWTDVGWVRVSDHVIARKVEIVPTVIRQDSVKVVDPTVKSRFIKFANETESAGKLAAIEKLAKAHPDVLRYPDDFDSQDDQLACRNGMLNLRDGTMRPFERDDLFTKNTGIIFDPDFRLEAWDNFLMEAAQGDQELIDYLQMAAGYTLTGSIAEECFFQVSGPTASGKSTFQDAIQSSMGTYAATTGSDTFMYRRGKEADRAEIVKFAGSRAVLTSEIKEGDYFDDAFIKRITGGDSISARLLYQEAFDFTPRFKIWIGTNHDPISSDSALFRRVKRIKFNHTVPPERRDRTLKALLKDPERGGKAVLAWAVKGAQKYYEAGRLIEPMSVTNSVLEYQSDQDSFSQFMNESFHVVPEAVTTLAQAYTQYQYWCTTTNEHPIKRPQFITRMKDRGYPRSYGDGGEQFFKDLRLKANVPVVGAGYR